MSLVELLLDILHLITPNECVPVTISYHLYFPGISKIWSMYVTSQWVEFRENNTTLCMHLLFWHFLVDAFHHKKLFIIFISFFDEISNFSNRILTNAVELHVAAISLFYFPLGIIYLVLPWYARVRVRIRG